MFNVMMSTKIVSIDLGARSYDIYIGAGLIFRAAELVPFDIRARRFFIVTDENVREIAENVQNMLNTAGAEAVYMKVLPAGETTKSYEHLISLTDWMLENGVARDSCAVAVGGGVIGDLTGFSASITMRGINFIQIPTTLLAQVDSAVGGKTGINTQQGKNLVGSFYQPRVVIIDTDTLQTLPERQILAGYAEIVKYGLINDAPFFHWLEEHGVAVCALEKNPLIHAIETSCRAKAAIVGVDERESGQRALLNLGHTFAHALESAAQYDGRLLHGEAVAIGMVMAYDLSVRMGKAESDDLNRVEDHLIAMGLPTRVAHITPQLNTTVDALYTAMQRDKKVKSGQLNLILADGIGGAYVSAEAPEGLILQVLQSSIGEY